MSNSDSVRKRNVETTTKRIQTTLRCFPHVGSKEVKVTCERGTQTAATLRPTGKNRDLYTQLQYLPYQLISKGCVRQLDLPRRAYLQFKITESDVLRSDSSLLGVVQAPKSALKRELLSQESLADISSIGRIHLYPPRVAYKMEDEEIQTRLRVFPHILDAREIANVSVEMAIQTSISCLPDASVTNLLPLLKTNLEHKSSSAVQIVRQLDDLGERRDVSVDNMTNDRWRNSFAVRKSQSLPSTFFTKTNASSATTTTRKPNNVQTLFAQILEGRYYEASSRYVEAWDGEKLAEAFKIIGDIIDRELAIGTLNGEVTFKDFQKAIGYRCEECSSKKPFSDSSHRAFISKGFACVCHLEPFRKEQPASVCSESSPCDAATLPHPSDTVVRLSIVFDNETIQEHRMQPGQVLQVSADNEGHPIIRAPRVQIDDCVCTGDELDSNVRQLLPYISSVTSHPHNLNCLCQPSPTLTEPATVHGLVVPFVHQTAANRFTNKRCCLNCNETPNSFFLYKERQTYYESYMEELIEPVAGVQTEDPPQADIRSTAFAGRSGQNANLEIQWDSILLPEGNFEIEPTKSKSATKSLRDPAVLSFPLSWKNDVKHTKPKKKIKKLLCDTELKNFCEPYMEGLRRAYTDTEEDGGDCGPKTEIPWQDIALPLNCIIRRKQNANKSPPACACLRTLPLGNDIEVSINDNHLQPKFSIYSTPSQMARKPKRSPNTYGFAFHVGGSKFNIIYHPQARVEITPSQNAGPDQSCMTINIKSPSICKFSSRYIPLNKPGEATTPSNANTHEDEEVEEGVIELETRHSVSLPNVLSSLPAMTITRTPGAIGSNPVSVQLHVSMAKSNSDVQTCSSSSSGRDLSKKTDVIKAAVESYKAEMKPLYDTLSDIHKKMEDLPLDELKESVNTLMGNPLNHIRNKIQFKSGFSGTVKTTIRLQPPGFALNQPVSATSYYTPYPASSSHFHPLEPLSSCGVNAVPSYTCTCGQHVASHSNNYPIQQKQSKDAATCTSPQNEQVGCKMKKKKKTPTLVSLHRFQCKESSPNVSQVSHRKSAHCSNEKGSQKLNADDVDDRLCSHQGIRVDPDDYLPRCTSGPLLGSVKGCNKGLGLELRKQNSDTTCASGLNS